MRNSVKVKGFYKLAIVDHAEDGTTKIVGKTPWIRNTVVNLGFQDYIVGAVGAIAGSKQVSHFALGTGTAPGATATSLDGELTHAAANRFTMTPSAVSSKTLQMVGTLASNIITATAAIQNIGVFNTSTTSAGTLLCGNTYTVSTLQTNQSVNVTYQLRFS